MLGSPNQYNVQHHFSISNDPRCVSLFQKLLIFHIHLIRETQDFNLAQQFIYIKYRIRDPQSSTLNKPLRRLTEEIDKDIGYKNEKHQSAFVDVDSFGAQQFNLHNKVSTSQRGKEYLSKLKNLLPSVFDEFKHDELERYSNMSYNQMKNSYFFLPDRINC